eukprot:7266301-Alexandrium_andersonii.AAC.1
MAALGRDGLDGHQLYNAQGNSFGRSALAIWIPQVVRTWLRGGEVRRHCFPGPTRTLRTFAVLRRDI